MRATMFILLCSIFEWGVHVIRHFKKQRNTDKVHTYYHDKQSIQDLYLVADFIVMCLHSMLIYDVCLIFNSFILKQSPSELSSFHYVIIIMVSNLLLAVFSKSTIDFEYIRILKKAYNSRRGNNLYLHLAWALFPLLCLFVLLLFMRFFYPFCMSSSI